MTNLRSGLVGEWLCRGNLKDTSGNGNDATAYGPTLTTDRLGRSNSAYDCDGGTDYIAASTSPNLDYFTISFWIYLRSYDSDGCFVGRTQVNNPWRRNYEISQNSSNYPRVIFYDETNATHRVANDTSVVPLNTWVHYTGTWDGTYLKFYRDGTLITTTDLTGLGATTGYYGDLTFMAKGTGNDDTSDGKISNIRLHNRALTAKEVSQLYNEIKPQYQDLFENVVGYWDLSNDAKDVINQNDGTVTGATLTTGRFGETNGAYNLTSGNTITWASTSHSTALAWEDTGSGWVLNRNPSYVSNTGVSGFVGDLSEIILFSSVLTTSQIDYFEQVATNKKLYPFIRGVKD